MFDIIDQSYYRSHIIWISFFCYHTALGCVMRVLYGQWELESSDSCKLLRHCFDWIFRAIDDLNFAASNVRLSFKLLCRVCFARGSVKCAKCNTCLKCEPWSMIVLKLLGITKILTSLEMLINVIVVVVNLFLIMLMIILYHYFSW